MTVQINGHLREIPNGVTVSALLTSLGLTARNILVEHNGQALLAREFDGVVVKDGDKLELVRIAAGG